MDQQWGDPGATLKAYRRRLRDNIFRVMDRNALGPLNMNRMFFRL